MDVGRAELGQGVADAGVRVLGRQRAGGALPGIFGWGAQQQQQQQLASATSLLCFCRPRRRPPWRRTDWSETYLFIRSSQYYNPPAGFLTFDPAATVTLDGFLLDGLSSPAGSPTDAPLGADGGDKQDKPPPLVVKEATTAAAPPPPQNPTHDELLDKELPVLFSAWAVARLLGRVLVLPHFVCGADAPFPGPRPHYSGPYSWCGYRQGEQRGLCCLHDADRSRFCGG